MPPLPELEDPVKTCVYLPPRQNIADRRIASPDHYHYSPYPARDLPGGYEFRIEAYRKAWTKCLNRIQTIVHELHAPLVSDVVSHIRNAYASSQTLPGLPYPELPIVVISAPGGSMSVFADILDVLNKMEDDSNRETQHQRSMSRRQKEGKGKARMTEGDEGSDLGSDHNLSAMVTHLHPADCPNLVSAMKAIVTGFVDRHLNEDSANGMSIRKRKATTSLASYDLNLLEAWYASLHREKASPPQLVLLLHDFEQFDTDIIQDVFYICSQHIPQLPLVFLLSLSTPIGSSYLHAALPRACLALLRVHAFAAPSGPDVIEEVLVKTFFCPEFEPDIMIGPGTLDFLADFCTRHTASLDAATTILQLAHMKHFDEPLTLFVHDTHLGTPSPMHAATLLQQPTSFAFLDTLLTRLWSHYPSPISISSGWQDLTVPALLDAVSAARAESRRRAQRLRLGFSLMRETRAFMRCQGYKTSASNTGREESGLDLLCMAVRGRLGRDLKYLGLMIKKLSSTQLEALLMTLHQFFQSLPSWLAREEEGARLHIITSLSSLPQDAHGSDPEVDAPRSPDVVKFAAGIGDWLVEFIESRLVRLDEGALWDVWNTGLTPFPSELINPAPKLTVIHALLHPYDFVEAHAELFQRGSASTEGDPTSDDTDTGNVGSTGTSIRQSDQTGMAHSRPRALWELPDTSILFRRYMEAGRMINVYDWFESFSVALEDQRRHVRKVRQQKSAASRDAELTDERTPRKGKGKERAEDVDMEVDEDVDGDGGGEAEGGEEAGEDDEKWSTEVQARFIRAVHELDFMGFIKHTGRKADHVLRTIYDLPD